MNQQMKAWLRENAERKAAEVLGYKSANITSPMIYKTTWRLTGSDVLSIRTTTKILVEEVDYRVGDVSGMPSPSPTKGHKRGGKKVGEAWVAKSPKIDSNKRD